MYYYRLISSMLKAVTSTLGTGLYAVYKGESNALASLTTSLYAVYKGESNANDSLGNYNGTPQGGLTYSAGKSGNAFTFNGTDADIDLISGFQFTGDFSVNFWCYITNSGQLQALVGNYNRTGTTRSGFLIGTNSSIYVYIGTNTPGTAIALASSLHIQGAWFMTTVTRKSSTGTKIYLNGVLDNSNTDTNNPGYSVNNRPYLGVYTADGVKTNFANSGTKIDEVNVWNRELTATEVTELYNAGNGKFYEGNAFYSAVVNDSLNTYNGTAQGGLTYTAGVDGNAFQFNGTTAEISIANNTFQFISEFSIKVDLNLPDVTTAQGIFSNFYQIAGPSYFGWQLWVYNGLIWLVRYDGTSNIYSLTSSISINTQYKIVFTRKNNETKCYINGTLVASDTNSNNNIAYTTTHYPRIGSRKSMGGPSDMFIVNNGKLDEIYIWSRALTSAEVTELQTNYYPF